MALGDAAAPRGRERAEVSGRTSSSPYAIWSGRRGRGRPDGDVSMLDGGDPDGEAEARMEATNPGFPRQFLVWG